MNRENRREAVFKGDRNMTGFSQTEVKNQQAKLPEQKKKGAAP
jgi:hypothetical protein